MADSGRITEAGVPNPGEKKKWQIALRRYVFRESDSAAYAPYFGLDAENLKKWLQLQLPPGVSWEEFGTKWQIEHVIPVSYFDFRNDAHLKLCWNFTNLRIAIKFPGAHSPAPTNLFAVKRYFAGLFNKTGYDICSKMLLRIEDLEKKPLPALDILEGFAEEKKEYLRIISSFSSEEFFLLNQGRSFAEIAAQSAVFKKFDK